MDDGRKATEKELQAFLKRAGKMRAKYSAAKKKVVTQLLSFSLKPMTADGREAGMRGDKYEKARVCLQGQNHEGFQAQSFATHADANLLRLFLAARAHPDK